MPPTDTATPTAADLERQDLRAQLDALREEFDAAAAEALSTNDPVAQVRLERRKAQTLAKIAAIEARLASPSASAQRNRAHLEWEQHLHLIDYYRPTDALESQVWRPHRYRACSALLLTPDSYAKCGDLLAERVREQLRQAGHLDLLSYPVGFRRNEPATPAEFLARLGGHLNVSGDPTDLAGFISQLAETLVGSLEAGGARLIQLDIQSGARLRRETCRLLTWLATTCWPALTAGLDGSPELGYAKLLLLVTIDDADIQNDLDPALWSADDAYLAGRFFTLALTNWDASDIARWLQSYSPLRREQSWTELLSTANDIVTESDSGRPRSVRNNLRDRYLRE